MKFRRKRKSEIIIVRPGDMLVAVNLRSIGVEDTISPQKVADLTIAFKELMGLHGFLAIGEDASIEAIEDAVKRANSMSHDGEDHVHG